MAKDTKERILDAALEIFARDGYAGTNLKDIADSVGIVKSALYRHFESKEALWVAVREMMVKYYEENVGAPDAVAFVPNSTDELAEMTKRIVEFTVHDKRIIQMRKLLLTEQFRDKKTCEFASEYFIYGTEARFSKIFSLMMEKGIIKNCDPEILAFSYTSPITTLIHLCDRAPEKEKEAMGKLDSFITNFLEEYGV